MTRTVASQNDSPHSNELEVSIFGPGKGEAVAVHLGGGDWITVDSCRNQRSGEHALLSYFSDIGVDPAASVRLVVATHAHDDHVSGIAELYNACTNARLSTSQAITSNEFFATIETDRDVNAVLNQRVLKEYDDLFEEVARRVKRGGLRPHRRALEQRVLWERNETGDLPSATVLALSPSDQAVTRALQFLAEGASKPDQRRRFSMSDPNEFAIALWVTVGSNTILLGADLTIGPEACGWKAVTLTHEPENKASLYKVPHHGSPNADYPIVWEKLLSAQVVSLIAPFRGSSNARPAEDDLERIVAKSAHVFSTAQTKIPAPSPTARNARRAFGSMIRGRNVVDLNGIPGQVRARHPITDGHGWSIDLTSPAYEYLAKVPALPQPDSKDQTDRESAESESRVP